MNNKYYLLHLTITRLMYWPLLSINFNKKYYLIIN